MQCGKKDWIEKKSEEITVVEGRQWVGKRGGRDIPGISPNTDSKSNSLAQEIISYQKRFLNSK